MIWLWAVVVVSVVLYFVPSFFSWLGCVAIVGGVLLADIVRRLANRG